MHVSGLEFLYRKDLGIVIQLEEVLVLYKNLTDLLRLLILGLTLRGNLENTAGILRLVLFHL